MSSTPQDKSGDRPRQRGRKAGQRDQKAARRPNPKPDQGDGDQIDAMIGSPDGPRTDALKSGTTAPAEQPWIGEVEPADVLAIDEVAAADAAPVDATASAGENAPVNIQTIANAYRDYTRKSLQENRSFVEKLMGVRSLDKAIEVQTDYARQAYANLVAESQKICGLYSELARQSFMPWKPSRPG